MAQAYLVGHGGALSPGTPGGDPVGNFLEKAIAVDNQRLRQQQSESYARQTQTSEKAQRLKALEQQLDLVGSASPMGQEIQREFATELGINYDPSTVAPESVTDILSNGRKQWAKIAGDPKLSDEEKQVQLFGLVDAANSAFARMGGTQSERKLAAEGIKDLSDATFGRAEAAQKASEYDRRSGVIEGRQQRVKASPGTPSASAAKTDPALAGALITARGVLGQRLRELRQRDDYQRMGPDARFLLETQTREVTEKEYGVPLTYTGASGDAATPEAEAPAGLEGTGQETGLDSPILDESPLPTDPAERVAAGEALLPQLLGAGFPLDKAVAEMLRRGFTVDEIPE